MSGRNDQNEVQVKEALTASEKRSERGTALAVRPSLLYKPRYTSRYDEASWQVRVFLPGVPKDEIKVTVENEILEIHATRPLNVPEGWRPLGEYPESKRYRLRLDVGPEVDASGITANQSDGILTLRLPLREEVKPRRIEVQ